MSNIFNQDFLEYIKLLDKHDVEYMLVGGMAVNLHGYRRSTGDMDIFVNPTTNNHKKMKLVHRDFGMFMGEMEDIKNFLDTSKYDVYTFGVSPIQIDVMTACKGLDFKQAYKKSVQFIADNNISVQVISYNDLIKAKNTASRARDKADIEELKKIESKKMKGKSSGLSM